MSQESLRQSLAGEAAARARHLANSTEGYYNLHIGPTAWNFGVNLGISYNDNVSVAGGGFGQAGLSDFIFSPAVSARMNWPVTDRNSLNMALGGGYSFYVQHSEFDRYFMTPGTELSYDIYVGNFWINLHDRISITQNTYQDPTVVGAGNYSQLQNVLGVAPTWDLGKVVLKAGYDHANYMFLQSGSTQNAVVYPDAQSDSFTLSPAYVLGSEIQAGLELGGSLLTYSRTTANTNYTDAKQWNVGPFVQTPISEYLQIRLGAGYTEYLPDSAAVNNFSGVYAQVAASHRLNEYLNYTLSGGRMVTFGYGGGALDLYFVTWQANWNFIRDFTLSTTFLFNHGTQLIGGGETFDQYGPGLSLSRPLTQKLSASLGYQYYVRTSDLPGRNYTVNIVTLNFNYQF